MNLNMIIIFKKRRKKKSIKKYPDEYLKNIIKGTTEVISTMLEETKEKYYGYWQMELQLDSHNCIFKPISLNLIRGHFSDMIFETTNGDLISKYLFKEILGKDFIIYTDSDIINKNDGDIVIEYVVHFLIVSGLMEILNELRNNQKIKKKLKK